MISIFDIFSIGVGPSSSHTVGPMLAANMFIEHLMNIDKLEEGTTQVSRVVCDLYGSLALTGIGHGTDGAVLIGLEGLAPDIVDPMNMQARVKSIIKDKKLHLAGKIWLDFNYTRDLIFNKQQFLPLHSNAMKLTALDKNQQIIFSETYYSIGGGFIATADELNNSDNNKKLDNNVPYPFYTAKKLLQLCEQEQKSISEIVMANELSWRDEATIKSKAQAIWQVMSACVDAGCNADGVLPVLGIKRRAPGLYKKMSLQLNETGHGSFNLGWLKAFAMAVNEENACGGKVVTAPTNGAAGIIPAVLKYYVEFYPKATHDNILKFLLTAGGICVLFKYQAGISGAEMGCQGEVGVACSMAAAALTEVLGGNVKQVENAAEIAMEHHLGLTCDPIDGLVQIPCIERNAIAAVKAVNIAHLALLEEGDHYVPLDKVIATMKQTGKDMLSIYKETSLGGLAVNHPEC